MPEVANLPSEAPVVCHGPAFLPRALGYPRLASGIFFDERAFRWSVFQERWPEKMLSLDGSLMPLAAALDHMRLRRNKCFVRPDHDSKAFDGAVFDADSFRSQVLTHVKDLDLPVVVASPLESIGAGVHIRRVAACR